MQLTVKDVAELLSVSEKSVYRWIEERNLPGYRLSGHYRFNRAELLMWATANRLNFSPKLFQEPETASAPLPELVESLQAGGIFYRLAAMDRETALQSVVDHLRLPDEVDRGFLLQMLLAREALEPTAIGEGIAIPHVRNPIVLHVPRPLVALCFLEQPVDFNAMDGRPVQVLFTLISPTLRAHLHLLSRLTYVLRDPALRALISRQGGRDEILAAMAGVLGGLKPPGAASAAGVTP